MEKNMGKIKELSEICKNGVKLFSPLENRSIGPDPLQVDLCIEFIQKYLQPAKKLHRRSSYGWKHVVERWAETYITNGAFIMAALLEGIDQDIIYKSTHTRLFLSPKTRAISTMIKKGGSHDTDFKRKNVKSQLSQII